MKLYIGGMLVHLPSNFSTEYYTKSPYFTNEGDFTLNIDLDLKDPANARAYAYLHRIDRTKKPSRREAVLQDETGVVIRGKEILLEVSDVKASIQIVAGASELNYEIVCFRHRRGGVLPRLRLQRDGACRMGTDDRRRICDGGRREATEMGDSQQTANAQRPI